MKDTTTQRPLSVSTDGGAGPYIIVPLEQLGQVQELLDKDRVSYWVDEEAISLNGAPELAIINLGQSADADAVQQLLNSVS
jgi:hypothetical protein